MALVFSGPGRPEAVRDGFSGSGHRPESGIRVS
jgi:hypothetical protein